MKRTRDFQKPGAGQVAANRGYTLLELMVVVAIVSFLAMLAVPGFQGFYARNAREGAILEFMSALSLARSEAIMQSKQVSICRSVDQATCAGSNGADWAAGWIIFTDAGVSGVMAPAEGDVVMRVQGPDTAHGSALLLTRLNGSFPGDFLQFDKDGFLSNSTSGAYFRFCPSDNDVANARAVLLSNTGRPARSVDDGGGVHSDLEGNDLLCP